MDETRFRHTASVFRQCEGFWPGSEARAGVRLDGSDGVALPGGSGG